MIFLCFIQNLTIAGSKEDFKSFFPTKAFAIVLDHVPGVYGKLI
jgi:hypothetical protein